jgi:hypothetical protein
VQSLFILSLFGIIYTTVAVITTMLSTSAMQLKLQRIDAVKEMFIDIESAIVDGYLGDHVDFSDLAFPIPANRRIDLAVADINDRIDKFLGEYISWTSPQLLKDPWGTDIFISMTSQNVTIYSDNKNPSALDGVGNPIGVNTVTAPINAFILLSAGPDKQFGTAAGLMPTLYNGANSARRYTKANNAAGEDDIVHVFTTFSAMNEMWTHTQDVQRKMMSIAGDNYKQQYELFTPQIQVSFYDVVDFYDASFNWIGDVPLAGSGCAATALIHTWKDPNCSITEVVSNGIAAGNLTGEVGFPVFTADLSALGLDKEEERLLQGLTPNINLTLPAASPTGFQDRLDFELMVDGGNDWNITYETRLEGSEIIGGL